MTSKILEILLSQITAINSFNGLFAGIPHGGIAILLCKSIRDKSQLHFYYDYCLLGITINLNNYSCYFHNVYLQCDDNIFVEYFDKLSAH